MTKIQENLTKNNMKKKARKSNKKQHAKYFKF